MPKRRHDDQQTGHEQAMRIIYGDDPAHWPAPDAEDPQPPQHDKIGEHLGSSYVLGTTDFSPERDGFRW